MTAPNPLRYEDSYGKRLPLRELALLQARQEAEKTGNLTLWRKLAEHHNNRRRFK
jgi:hypothetical protein